MSKAKVAILYGGRSVEHGVSINSAKNIFEYIDREKFEPYPIGISKKGVWYLTSAIDKEIEKGKPLTLQLNPGNPSFQTGDGKTIHADVVFPVLHGTDGEDGSIQGLLKAMELPMVGTGVLGSAMSMSKLVTKRLLKEAGIPVTKFRAVYFNQKESLSFPELEAEFGLPFMVKAASLGSSVGISKVKNETDFLTALNEAFRYDDSVLIEQYVKGREIECAILGNYPPEASLPGEIIISPKYEFYTFDAKYVDGEAVKIEVPAKLEAPIAEKIRELSIKTYQALHCEDFSRIDLFLGDDGKIYINEINTIPGFTNSSMYPMMWKDRGISFPDLITKLIALCRERFERSKRIERDFQSALKF
jgi:D-alanine-D-alanine ligase